MSPPAARPPDRYLLVGMVCALAALLHQQFLVAATTPTPAGVDALHSAGRPVGVSWVMIGTGVGALLALPYPHGFRGLGLVPVAATLLFAGSVWGVVAGEWVGWLGGGLGVLSGVVFVRAGVLHRPGGPARGAAVAGGLAAGACGVAVVNGVYVRDLLPWDLFVRASGLPLVLLSGFLGAFAWWHLRRPFVEFAVEFPMRVLYRVRPRGPGVTALPAHGPVLVIANHASYFDPLFLAAFVPRPITPLMTASFFDKPVVRQLMTHVFDTIRVGEDPIKRDATEIPQAIDAIAAGKCLVVFPEGYLRRREDVPLRRFGRGVWEVLRAHPGTPVVACWIEGCWGSYFSFKDGPPATGKPVDFRRPIGVGVSAPAVVPADILADHLATRFHLMDLVLGARDHLDLPALPDAHKPQLLAAVG